MRKLSFLSPVFLLFALASFFILPGCTSTENLTTAAPTTTAAAMPAYQPKLSSVTVPVSVSLATIEHRLNQEFSGILYKDDNLEGDDVAVTVAKSGKLTIRAEKDKVYVSVPLHIYAKGRWKWDPCKYCPAIDKTEDTSFDVVIKTESKVNLTDNYSLNTVTSGDFEWGATKPVIELGPMRIGLARFVEPALHKQMATLTVHLDKELQKYLNVRKYVAQAWHLVQEPVKLNDEMNAWLTIVPKDVRMAPLQTKDGMLSTRIGITSYMAVTTQGKPTVQYNKNLPKLIIDSRLQDDVQVGLTGTIPYAQASEMLCKQVLNQTYTFDAGKSEITVNEAAITPSGDQLVLMLDINGKSKTGMFTKKIAGKVYLRGTPYYDPETTSIKVRDLDYTLDTKDKLLSTASWLAKNKFKDMIQQQAGFPVKTQLDNTKKMLQQTLNAAGRVHESVLLRGTIHDITPETIYLTPKGIKAVVNARGKLTLLVDKL